MVRFIHPLKLLVCCVLAAVSVSLPLETKAAGFEELHHFPRFGKAPSGIVRGPTGDFYGVTTTGGLNEFGTLYRVSGATGAVETLANFGGTFGVASPSPQIAVDVFGNVYGLSNSGTCLWRWNASTGLHFIALLSDLGLSGTIDGVVLDKSGGLVGTATGGGANGAGVLWRWQPGTVAQRLGDFVQANTGLTTKSRLAVDSQGAIYGCSDARDNLMILWRWKAAVGFEKLAELPTVTYGSNGLGLTIDGSDRVWGITSLGGAQDDGTLWRWSQAGGLEKLADFNPAASDQKPTGPVLIGADGSAFGASALAIWRWSQLTGLVRHADLPVETVGYPSGEIALDEAGVIYGASSSGAPYGCVWKCSAAGGAVKLRDFTFDYAEEPFEQGIARDAQGRIYGTTTSPNEPVPTVLWRWSDSNGYEQLASFETATFSRGATTPFIAADGNVYGIVESDGFANPGGRLWRWNEAQGLVKLADFIPYNEGMAAPVLVLGNAGQVYGTCGNNNGTGSIWKWTAGGGIEKLATFDRQEVVFSPNQITGANGEWYGVQLSGGPALGGRLWSFSETAGLVFHHEFSGFDGNPRGVLARDPSGNIYGTRGTPPTISLWRWNQTDGFTTLETFDGPQGFSPISLRADRNGLVRGICESGGAFGRGTIWNWSENFGFFAIHHFRPDTTGKFQAPILAGDAQGNLYGLANGVLWRYTASASPSAPTVTTGFVRASNSRYTRFEGAINANGYPTTFSFRWGESPDNLPYTASSDYEDLSGTFAEAVYSSITELPQRRLFFGRLEATNSGGTTLGDIVSFITSNYDPTTEFDSFHSPPIAQGSFDLDVLANDEDGSDQLTLISVEGSNHGTVTIVDNKVHYSPDASYDGNDSFTYEVSDGHGGVSSEYVSLYNDGIEAANDVVTRGSGSATILPLANDRDEDDDALTIIGASQPAHGSVSFEALSLSYHPAAGFTGTDRFTYTVTDNRGKTATATVEVRPGNIEPRAMLSIGDVLSLPSGDLTVKKISAAGSTGDGVLRIGTEVGGRPASALLNTADSSLLLLPGQPVPDVPGSAIKKIDEPAGRAVLVTYTVDGSPKVRRALLFLNREGVAQLVAREGQTLPDDATLASIGRFSEVNGRVLLLGKLKLSNGKLIQSLRLWENGQVTELARPGAEIGFYRVKSITCLVPAPGSPADNRWIDDRGQIVASMSLQDGNVIGRGQYLLKDGEEPSIEASTFYGSGFYGGRYLRLGLPAVCPDGLAYSAFEGLPLGEGRVWTMYMPRFDDGIDPVDYTGTVVTEEPVTLTKQLGDPVASDAGIAYLARAGGKGLNFQVLVWLYWPNRSLVVRQGDLLPGSETERFRRIKSLVLPRGTTHGPVFTAMTSKGFSLWSTSDEGRPQLLVKPGMTLMINGNERTVTSFRALEGSKGPGIAVRGFDSVGHVEALIKFADGSESLVQFTLP